MTTTTTEHIWTDPHGWDWLVSLTWQPMGGRIECIGVSVTQPAPALRVMTAVTLRGIPIGQFMDEGRLDYPAVKLADEAIADVHTLTARELPRRGVSEQKALVAAAAYSRAWARGARNPIAAAVEAFDPPVARSTAGRYVWQARNVFGFLEPTTGCNANGTLTAKALALLDDVPPVDELVG